jgi:hypothetical protein
MHCYWNVQGHPFIDSHLCVIHTKICLQQNKAPANKAVLEGIVIFVPLCIPLGQGRDILAFKSAFISRIAKTNREGAATKDKCFENLR